MTTNGNHHRRDYRCPSCGRLWFRAYISDETVIQIRCTRSNCRRFYVIGKDNLGLFIREDEQTEIIT